jgi:hypothetical protein
MGYAQRLGYLLGALSVSTASYYQGVEVAKVVGVALVYDVYTYLPRLAR